MSENAEQKKAEKKVRGKKRDSPEARLAQEVEACEKEYQHWQYLYEFGGSDPFYSDGSNMYLVRNHIIYYKKQMEKICSEAGIQPPDVYYRELPPNIPKEYMARPDEIRHAARKSLAVYEKASSYISLCEKGKQMSPKQKKEVCFDSVMWYVSGLRKAIEEDDLITMRRHRNPNNYAESFKSCLERIEKLQPEEYQLTLFDMIA